MGNAEYMGSLSMDTKLSTALKFSKL